RSTQARALLSRAGDPQREPKSPKGIDGDVQSLVWGQSSHAEEVVTFPAPSQRKFDEPLQFHRWRYDRGRATVQILDLLGDVKAVGDKSVDSLRRAPVPSLKHRSGRKCRNAGRPPSSPRTEVIVVAVPHVAHGRMDVAQMPSTFWFARAL